MKSSTNVKAIDVVKQMVADGQVSQEVAEKYFPELKESEDEKIRKEIVKFIVTTPKEGNSHKKWIAWLEKQGESIKIKKGKNYLCTKTHKYAGVEWTEGIKYYSPEDYSLVNQGCTCYCPKYSKEEHNKFFKEVEYDGCLEVNKIGLKFKVGDWVVCKNGSHRVFQVIERSWPNAKYLDEKGAGGFLNVFTLDKQYRPWTIQDAKDGDVLSYRDGQWIFIYKERIDDSSFCYHTLYSTIHQDLTINDAAFTLLGDAIIPATKEQRDTLFAKMKEAGYEWDAEKKELKKIEHKPAEWSEEDETGLTNTIIMLKEGASLHFNKKDITKAVDWLKSLKERYTWKPSDEQIAALRFVRKAKILDPEERESLNSLYIQLKKLKKL